MKPWANKWAKFELTAAPHGPLWADTPASLATGFAPKGLGFAGLPQQGWVMCLDRICLSARRIPKRFTNNLWGIYKLTAQQLNGHHCLHTCKQKKSFTRFQLHQKGSCLGALKISLNENSQPSQPCKPHRNTIPYGHKLSELVQLPLATTEGFHSNIYTHNHIAVWERIPRNSLDA